MGAEETDDSEERPVGKKAKAATPAANGGKGKEVKSEALLDDGQVSEAEMSFY